MSHVLVGLLKPGSFPTNKYSIFDESLKDGNLCEKGLEKLRIGDVREEKLVLKVNQ